MTYALGYDVGYDPDNPEGGGSGIHAYVDLSSGGLFSGQAGFSDQVPWPLGAILDGVGLVLDLELLELGLIDQLRDARDQGALPSEGSLSTEAAWKRTRSDWSQGAGQEWADSEEPEVRRFYRSLGIDPWTKRTLRLQPQVEVFDAATVVPVKLLAVGGYLYKAEGASLKHTDDPDDTTVIWTDVAGFTGTIGPWATDGNELFYADTLGIRRSTLGTGTSAAFGGAASTFVPTVLAYANGWLFAAAGNEVHQVNADGSLTLVKAHDNAGFVWSAIVGHPGAVYLGGQANDVNELYAVAEVNDDGTLAPPLYVGALPRGELLNDLEYYQGVLLLATTKGLRLAEVADTRVDLGDLVPLEGGSECCTADGRYVWFGWSYDATHTGLGRCDLGELVDGDNLIPAYASDLQLVGTGTVLSVARFAGKTYFSVSEAGCARAVNTGDLVDVGTIELGRFTWDIYEPKTYLGAELVCEPLSGAVSAAVMGDDGTFTGLGDLSIDGSTGLGVNLGGNIRLVADSIRPVLTLHRNELEPTIGPVVRRFSQWVLPVPRNVSYFELPVKIDETIKLEIGDGQDYGQDPWGLWSFLTNLARTAQPATLQIGKATHQVIVRGLTMPRGQVRKWDTRREWFAGTVLVRLVTKEF